MAWPRCCGIVGNEVGQVAVLGMVPHRFHGVQLGCVGGQPFDLQPTIASQSSGRRAMNIPAIPDQDQLAAQLTVQVFDELHHVVGDNVVIVQPKVHADSQGPRSQAQGADHAPAVVAIPGVVDRRLTARRPGATPQGLQHEAAFVEKHDASFLLAPPFLSAAIPPSANAGSSLRLARGLAARASARSNPACATACRCSPRDTSRRTAVESPPTPADRSTSRWHTRWPGLRAAESWPAALSASRSIAVVGPG